MGSIDPKIWGPSAWLLLHDVSFHIAHSKDTTAIDDVKPLFMSLRHILPCTRCQLSYDMHLLHLPFPKTNKDLPKWVYDLHNRVNDANKHTSRMVWKIWSARYPHEMVTHRLKDIWPFIQSIAETYPSGNSYDVVVYQENARIFFSLLWDLLRNMKGYSRDVFNIETVLDRKELDKHLKTERGFKIWITNIGKTVHIAYDNHYHCSKECEK